MKIVRDFSMFVSIMRVDGADLLSRTLSFSLLFTRSLRNVLPARHFSKNRARLANHLLV
jgi:hypothetical protein